MFLGGGGCHLGLGVVFLPGKYGIKFSMPLTYRTASEP
jgi:hypothetical protein